MVMFYACCSYFPGQGAQSVGMLADVENRSSIIKQRFAEASEALSFDLWQMTKTDQQRHLVKQRTRNRPY